MSSWRLCSAGGFLFWLAVWVLGEVTCLAPRPPPLLGVVGAALACSPPGTAFLVLRVVASLAERMLWWLPVCALLPGKGGSVVRRLLGTVVAGRRISWAAMYPV